MGPIRVLLIDNEEVFREGLARLIEAQPHMEVVHHCAAGGDAVIKTGEMNPDVVLIDTQAPRNDIVNLVTEITKSSPRTKVALFARDGSDVALLDTMKAGARACLAKNISADDLVKSIELVSSGRIIISPVFAERFLSEISSGADKEGLGAAQEQTALSEREMEIVALVVRGASNKEIAGELFIAENTVKVHVKNILNKLELRNRQQLVAYAVLRNWVALDIAPEKERPKEGTP